MFNRLNLSRAKPALPATLPLVRPETLLWGHRPGSARVQARALRAFADMARLKAELGTIGWAAAVLGGGDATGEVHMQIEGDVSFRPLNRGRDILVWAPFGAEAWLTLPEGADTVLRLTGLPDLDVQSDGDRLTLAMGSGMLTLMGMGRAGFVVVGRSAGMIEVVHPGRQVADL